ncbi:MFS-type transporter SLC18B1 [Galendromus occidentalis]|uniref:MFS-type transporter SLC18B1 n=1 Tax=Galendromus occidentalis TaxID=34638 RepID=A0AAJ6QN51_9ACAR|nr:MFS-type transporter SLC18B1 [Galendromus occidentalis]
MLTWHQRRVLGLALVESFMLSAHYAVFMPFYPNVAEEKGNTPLETGMFFAAGSVVGLVGSPLVGVLLKRGFAPKRMVTLGLILSGVFLVIHGFYKDLFKGGREFFYANLGTKIVHSTGPVMATTAIYPIVAVELGESRGRYLPFLEAMYNGGLMIWPCVGSILYDKFGYTFPFVSVGLSSLVLCVILMIFLPNPKKAELLPGLGKNSGGSTMDLTLFLLLANIAMCYLIIGFNDITLSTELAIFRLNHTEVGFCFAVAPVCYGACIYMWGLLSKARRGQFLAISIGFALSVGGLFFLAPCRLLTIEPTLHVRLLGQALMGIGLAALFTSSMVFGMQYVTEGLRMDDDVATHGYFSSLVFFSLSFGYVVGHAGFAGLLLNEIGYENVILLIVLSALILFLFNLIQTCIFESIPSRRGYESINGTNHT